MQKKSVAWAFGFVLGIANLAEAAQVFDGENGFSALAPSDLREPYRCEFMDPKVKVLFIRKKLKKKPSDMVLVIGNGSKGGTFVGFQDPQDPSSKALGYLFKYNLFESAAADDAFVDLSIKEDAKRDEATISLKRDPNSGSAGAAESDFTNKPSLASQLQDTPFGKKIKLERLDLAKDGEKISLTLKGNFDVLPAHTKIRLPLKEIQITFDRSDLEGKARVKLPFFISGSESWLCDSIPSDTQAPIRH
jgi:hypothetical protein